ncbi:MAG: plasmid-related protein [Steroidobacteraceae bacterium]
MAIKIKDAGLRLRVEKELRQEFVDACRATGKPAAQVLREFMRDFVSRERVMIQRPLFEEGRR